MRRYLKANKITTKHEISPEEDGNWYRVVANRPYRIPGVGAHREIDVVCPDSPTGQTTFTLESGEEVLYRDTKPAEAG